MEILLSICVLLAISAAVVLGASYFNKNVK